MTCNVFPTTSLHSGFADGVAFQMLLRNKALHLDRTRAGTMIRRSFTFSRYKNADGSFNVAKAWDELVSVYENE